MKEAVRTSETSFDIYQTSRRNILDDRRFLDLSKKVRSFLTAWAMDERLYVCLEVVLGWGSPAKCLLHRGLAFFLVRSGFRQLFSSNLRLHAWCGNFVSTTLFPYFSFYELTYMYFTGKYISQCTIQLTK
jgi:hypothetical protein